MKQGWPKFLVISIIFLISLSFGKVCLSQEAFFTTPRRGAIIENRQDFSVAVQIEDTDPRGYYWVALASVSVNRETWKRVVELFNQINSGSGYDASSEMQRLLNEWAIDLFWPKFYIPKSPYQGRVFDGGTNPLHGLEPQPMILLVLKVDDALQNYFRNWLRSGTAGRGYPGIPASRLGRDMVLERCEIFFP